MAKAKTIKVKLVKGLAGANKDQLAVIASLGLRKTNDVSEQPDNAATRGKVAKVAHLVQVL
jgi:large subunit ribosomal protein L30